MNKNDDIEIKAGFLIAALQHAGASVAQIALMNLDEMKSIINTATDMPFSQETWDQVFSKEVLEKLPTMLAALEKYPGGQQSIKFMYDEYYKSYVS